MEIFGAGQSGSYTDLGPPTIVRRQAIARRHRQPNSDRVGVGDNRGLRVAIGNDIVTEVTDHPHNGAEFSGQRGARLSFDSLFSRKPESTIIFAVDEFGERDGLPIGGKHSTQARRAGGHNHELPFHPHDLHSRSVDINLAAKHQCASCRVLHGLHHDADNRDHAFLQVQHGDGVTAGEPIELLSIIREWVDGQHDILRPAIRRPPVGEAVGMSGDRIVPEQNL